MNAAPNQAQRPEDPDEASRHHPSGAGRRPVSEIMSYPVLALTPERVLDDALQALARFGVRHLAVVGAGGRCLGIVSDRMIVSAWAHNMSCLHTLQVRELLEPELPSVHPQATITDVARVMGRLRVDAVVVTDADGTLAGIVTGSDLVALLGRDE